MITTIWLNGTFVQKDRPLIYHDDSGFLRGAGVFDSMLAVNGEPVAAREHFTRLCHDCETVLCIECGLDFETFYDTAKTLLQKNGIDKGHYARIRTQITGGILKEFLGRPTDPTLSMSCSRTRTPDNQVKIKARIVSDYPRIAGCKLENCKKLDYTRSYCAMQEVKAKGADEPILTNTNGNIACASTSSLFIVEGQNLITPPLSEGILDSISRRHLIRDYGAKEETIPPERLSAADGIYLSNTIRGIRPVLELDGKAKDVAAIDAAQDLHQKIFRAV